MPDRNVSWPLVTAPTVVVSGAVAARIFRPLENLVTQARRRGEQVHPEVAATVFALGQLAQLERRRSADALDRSAHGTGGIPGVDAAVIVLSVSDVADLLGISERAVRARAGRGTLPARKVAGAWQFDPLDIDEVQTTRNEERWN